jgi:hypothetical protein
VNDIAVSDRAALAKRREQVMAADEIKLTLERAQKPKVITYVIRN